MQTSFYTSGFLYSLKTHQILLLQSPPKGDLASFWSMLGGEGGVGEEANEAFQRIVHEQLDVDLKVKHIHPVYDYFHDKLDKTNYVFYAEIKAPRIFKAFKDSAFSWVRFSEIVKLMLSAHTKQDVIVGERVINAKWRDDEAKKTLLTS